MSKTIKVRIPFVIGPDGKWCAYGYPNAQRSPDWSMMEEVADDGDSSLVFQQGWITAELPLPEQSEVAGSVEE